MAVPDALPPPPADIVGDAEVVILTRTGCCLCDDAIVVARSVCAELGASLALCDVDTDPQLRRDWNDHVPVTFVRGERHAIWALDRNGLVSALGRSVSSD